MERSSQHGDALLGLGLRLREMDGDPAGARIAFEQAGTALEAVTAKGDRVDSDRDFHFVMAAAAYHLARYSARAYSLLAVVQAEDNFSLVERALAQLMFRDFSALKNTVLGFRTSGIASDEHIAAAFRAHLGQAEAQSVEGADEDGSSFIFDGLDLALTDSFFSALSILLLAIERGEQHLLDQALARLREGHGICAEINLLPQWWSYRIAVQSSLWERSLTRRTDADQLTLKAALVARSRHIWWVPDRNSISWSIEVRLSRFMRVCLSLS